MNTFNPHHQIYFPKSVPICIVMTWRVRTATASQKLTFWVSSEMSDQENEDPCHMGNIGSYWGLGVGTSVHHLGLTIFVGRIPGFFAINTNYWEETPINSLTLPKTLVGNH